jgi:hypothetical protein
MERAPATTEARRRRGTLDAFRHGPSRRAQTTTEEKTMSNWTGGYHHGGRRPPRDGELEGEAEAVAQALGVSHEGELEQFLFGLLGPLLGGLMGGGGKELESMVMEAAVPVLKRVGAAVMSGSPPPRARAVDHEQEWWDGYRWHHHHRPWGEPEAEQEDFLKGILGGLFGELEGMDHETARHEAARWYVRLAHRSARLATSAVESLARSGPVTLGAVRRIVFDAVREAAEKPCAHGCGGSAGEPAMSGTWVRHGSRLIVHL